MALSKLLFLSFLLVILASNGVHSDSDSSRGLQLDQLNSKISLLESHIDERTHELTRKDERIEELESTIDSKLAKLASLQSELQLLQEKGSLNAKELVAKANVRATELELQIDVLRKQIEAQSKKKDTLETSTNAVEDKIQELNLKLESLQRISEEQNARIIKTKRVLKVAQEEVRKAKMEASSVSKQLEEVEKGWLPPWLVLHLLHFQSIGMTYWNEHGRPALDYAIKKALETKSEVVIWVEPHIQTFKTKWIPAVKERSVEFARDVGPHAQRLKTRTVDLYHTSKTFMEPYIQEARKFSEPYVDHISVVMKPHIDKARILLQPYTKKVHRHYRKVKKSVSLYHRQAQENIQQMLKNHEVTKPYATKELTWYLASILLALPVIILINMASDFMRKKPKKRSRRHHTGQTRRRAKRAHPEK